MRNQPLSFLNRGIRNCIDCNEPEESPEGDLFLDENGRCETCADLHEMAKIMDEEAAKEKDHDYSMND